MKINKKWKLYIKAGIWATVLTPIIIFLSTALIDLLVKTIIPIVYSLREWCIVHKSNLPEILFSITIILIIWTGLYNFIIETHHE